MVNSLNVKEQETSMKQLASRALLSKVVTFNEIHFVESIICYTRITRCNTDLARLSPSTTHTNEH
jgi:hypothetical protein